MKDTYLGFVFGLRCCCSFAPECGEASPKPKRGPRCMFFRIEPAGQHFLMIAAEPGACEAKAPLVCLGYASEAAHFRASRSLSTISWVLLCLVHL